MTLLCVPILVHDAAAALADAAAAKAAGADLAELRLDGWFQGTGDAAEMAAVADLVRDCPLPVIVTCRAASEGGHYDGPDDARVALYEYLGTSQHPPRYLDLELATYERSANLRQKVHLAIDYPARRRADAPSLILSIHDFNTRPADLARRIARIAVNDAASIIKVAYRARSIRDNLELLDVITETGKPTIALGMGEFGLMSRILAPKFGGFLTFASLRPTTTTAPGQPTIAELLNRYNFRSIKRSTRVYGVIGWPVEHSISPAVHNAAFDAIMHDGVYVPLPVPASDDPEASYASFKATVLELLGQPGMYFSGASVTIPHKENLVRLAREQRWLMYEESESTGAANTINATTGNVVIYNTDIPAIVECIQAEAGLLAGKRVAVIGAGGVGRGATWGLAKAGAIVVLFNRTPDRAIAAATQLTATLTPGVGTITAGHWDDLGTVTFDIFVNCTPLGMKGGPSPDESPLPEGTVRRLTPATIVMDTVYNPSETPLLRACKAAGAKTIPGVEMFIRQASLQSLKWTNQTPPDGLVRMACQNELSRGGPA